MSQAGKGDGRRPSEVSYSRFSDNWDNIFGPKFKKGDEVNVDWTIKINGNKSDATWKAQKIKCFNTINGEQYAFMEDYPMCAVHVDRLSYTSANPNQKNNEQS